MIVYRIINEKLNGLHNKPIEYVLKKNWKNILQKKTETKPEVFNIIDEYWGVDSQGNKIEVEHQKPFFNGAEVIETITQAEIIERIENELKQTARTSLILRKQKGEKILEDTFSWMEEKLLNGLVNQTTYDNIIDALEAMLAPLKNGRLIKVKNILEGLSVTGGKEQLRVYIIGLINTELGIYN